MRMRLEGVKKASYLNTLTDSEPGIMQSTPVPGTIHVKVVTECRPSLTALVRGGMFAPQPSVKLPMLRIIFITLVVVKAIMVLIEPVVYTIVPDPSPCSVSVPFRTPAVPAAVAGIVTINKLAAFATVLIDIKVAIPPTPALVP